MGCVSSQSDDLERDRPKSDVETQPGLDDDPKGRGGNASPNHHDSIVPGGGGGGGRARESGGDKMSDSGGGRQPLVPPPDDPNAAAGGATGTQSPNRIALDASAPGDGGTNDSLWRWLREVVPPKETTVNR